MEPRAYLNFLSYAARLKDVPRHCMTPGGRPEDVAGHSWRIALMAMLLTDEFPEIDMDKVIRMCLIHDLGEAVTGDIPTFQKTAADEAVEEKAVKSLLAVLPEADGGGLAALYAEMDAQKTAEARFYKALDKLEAVISHNEAELDTWAPIEYELNLTYAMKEAEPFPFLKHLRAEMLRDTKIKIGSGGKADK